MPTPRRSNCWRAVLRGTPFSKQMHDGVVQDPSRLILQQMYNPDAYAARQEGQLLREGRNSILGLIVCSLKGKVHLLLKYLELPLAAPDFARHLPLGLALPRFLNPY